MVMIPILEDTPIQSLNVIAWGGGLAGRRCGEDLANLPGAYPGFGWARRTGLGGRVRRRTARPLRRAWITLRRQAASGGPVPSRRREVIRPYPLLSSQGARGHAASSARCC